MRRVAYSDTLGYPVEIVLMTKPSLLKAGDTIYFEAVYQKAGLADQLAYVGPDKDGVAQFVITGPAVWYIHTNRMEKSESPGFDFESDRASLTFQVRYIGSGTTSALIRQIRPRPTPGVGCYRACVKPWILRDGR